MKKKIKWNAAKKIYQKVKKNDLPKGIVEIVKQANTHNIMIDFFVTLLAENDKNYQDYGQHMGLIKLCTIKLFAKLFGHENNLTLSRYVDNFYHQYAETLNLPNNHPNLEKPVAIEHKIVDAQDLILFNNHHHYCVIAWIFASPFLETTTGKLYYEFAYYAQMYIILNLYSNQHFIPDNYEVYLAKLDIQLKMIKVLAQITPQNYNHLVKKINNWFDKMERKEVKMRKGI